MVHRLSSSYVLKRKSPPKPTTDGLDFNLISNPLIARFHSKGNWLDSAPFINLAMDVGTKTGNNLVITDLIYYICGVI